MTFKRKILKQAALEYRGIVDYLVRGLHSPQAARDFIEEFTNKLDLVCEMPESHALSRMEELAVLGYRPMLVKNYVALYKIEDDCVVIAHIFHQSQDYARFV